MRVGDLTRERAVSLPGKRGAPAQSALVAATHSHRPSADAAPRLHRRALLVSAPFLVPLAEVQPAVSADDGDGAASDAFAAAAPGVVAVGVLSGPTGSDTFTVLCSGLLWGRLGHVVAPYSPTITALRRSGPESRVAVALLGPDDSTAAAYPVAAVSQEPSLELLVLQLPPEALSASRLQPARLVSSAAVRIGQDAYLIGTTPAARRTLSAGVVSSKGRSVPASNGQLIRGALQTDADLGPLGLGGALVDSSGRVIGTPTRAFSPPGGGRSSGVNFALGSDALLEAVPKMIAYGNVAGRR